jgi:hypothetical protein
MIEDIDLLQVHKHEVQEILLTSALQTPVFATANKLKYQQTPTCAYIKSLSGKMNNKAIKT